MPGKTWNASEVNYLKSMLIQGYPITEIKIPRRTKPAIRNKAKHLGFIGHGFARRPWPKIDENILRRCIIIGQKPTQIFKSGVLSGYTYNAIVKKASHLGLVDKNLSKKVKATVRLTPKQKGRLKRFLRKNVMHKTPEQMTLVWNETHKNNVSLRQVRYYLCKMNINRPRREVIAMPFSKAKMKKSLPKRSNALKYHWVIQQRILEQRLKKITRHLKEFEGEGLVTQKCKCCNREWPARAPFFIVKGKYIRAGYRTYVQHTCLLCANRNRREKQREKVGVIEDTG